MIFDKRGEVMRWGVVLAVFAVLVLLWVLSSTGAAWATVILAAAAAWAVLWLFWCAYRTLTGGYRR